MRPARDLVAKYPGTCATCGTAVAVGDTVRWHRRGVVTCTTCPEPEPGTVPTTRERLEAKADRRDAWAEARASHADAIAAELEADPRRHDWAFITQPGRIVARERMNRADERRFEHQRAAAEHARRADGIRSQLAHAIYDDDPDAIERLREKLEGLEAERERINAANKAYRKAHRAELAKLTAYERSRTVPHAPYELQNLGGNITRTRQRLARLEAAAARREAVTP